MKIRLNIKRIMLLATILVLLCRAVAECAPLTIADATDTFEGGRKVEKGTVKIVDLSGTWFEMGRQYGALMKKELDEVFLFVNSIIEYKEGNAHIADEIVQTQIAQTPWRIDQFFRASQKPPGSRWISCTASMPWSASADCRSAQPSWPGVIMPPTR